MGLATDSLLGIRIAIRCTAEFLEICRLIIQEYSTLLSVPALSRLSLNVSYIICKSVLAEGMGVDRHQNDRRLYTVAWLVLAASYFIM